MIDQHAHPFALAGGPLDLASISLDVRADDGADERRRNDGPRRVFQELLTVRLAARLGCEPDEVSAARGAASEEWPAYCAGLFADSGITDLVLDAGFAPEAEAHLDDYARLSGCSVHPIFRIEPLLDRLIGDGSGAAEIVASVEEAMAKVVAEGCVGFKTIAAYRTGLSIDPTVTVAEADASLRRDAGLPVRRRAKAMRDLGASRIDAALGPSIHSECYEFSPGDLDRAADRFGPTVRGMTATGRPALDLPAMVRVSLGAAGVELVADEDLCTACSPTHFSYRARGERQRMALVVWRA